jgi:hypothetical protein
VYEIEKNEMLWQQTISFFTIFLYSLTLSDLEGGPLVLGVVVSVYWWETLPPYMLKSVRWIIQQGIRDFSPPESVMKMTEKNEF